MFIILGIVTVAHVLASLPVAVNVPIFIRSPLGVVIDIPLTVTPWHLSQFIIEAGKPGGAVGAMAACAVAAKIIKIPQNNIACSIFLLVFVDAIIDIIDIIIVFLLKYEGFNLGFTCKARIQVEAD